VSGTVHCSLRLPGALREQIAATAAAEDRSFSAIVVALLDRGITERARESALIREMVDAFDATQEAA
jgi:hypothetical protein